MESFRLPSGKTTTSQSKYVAVWRKLGRDVCSVLGSGHHVFAFDPGLAIKRPGAGVSINSAGQRVEVSSYQSISIDADVALAIQNLYLENQKIKQLNSCR